MSTKVNIKHLIALVEERPVIWDKICEEYKFRNLKTAAWNDICSILIENFKDLPIVEKMKKIDMAPLVLQGETLGQKHRFYNEIVKERIESQVHDLPVINYNDPDVDNLLKIDIACQNRNVEYILQVLKCEDMVYVSRAIKKSTWLITEQQYAHIINPQYLHSQLFPEMTSRSICKLTLQIRLVLKYAPRVEDFFKYYEEKDLKAALKWLPYCSLPFIEKMVEKHADVIETPLMKRLCERSITVLEAYYRKCNSMGDKKRVILEVALMFLDNEPDKYLDMYETVSTYRYYGLHTQKFGRKTTKIIIKKHEERIFKNIDKYIFDIDIPTLAKYFDKKQIKDFLLRQAKTDGDCLPYRLFEFENFQLLINRIPKDERFEFVKQVFIDKIHKVSGKDCILPQDSQKYAMSKLCEHIQYIESYHWYIFAPFEIAFVDIKKRLACEENPYKRNLMFEVLLHCTRNNQDDVKKLLQFYHDKYNKEPYKSTFLGNLIHQTNFFKFDESTWKYLENMYKDLDVYTESDEYVQNFVESIIVYKIVHDKKVEEIIEKKFIFDSLKSYAKRLNQLQREKLFSYLYNHIQTKISKHVVTNKEQFDEALTLTNNILNLLKDWNKDLLEYPIALEKIKELIKINKENSWNVNLSCLYNLKKAWKKHMFQESFLLYPSEAVCINALKHDPTILSNYSSELNALSISDTVSLQRLLGKLRMYWQESLAEGWKSSYRARLEQAGGHKALIRGLCALLPRQELLNVIMKYIPEEGKIDWDKFDELILSLQRHIATNMHIARPQPPVEAILEYAKGDFLQYALPSLHAIFYNLSAMRSQEYIPKLWDAPVSLQKHGIRFAYVKLEPEDSRQAFLNIWKSSKNATIRAVIFQLTHKLICREKNSSRVEDLWQMLNVFTDTLNYEEDKSIYDLLANVKPLPVEIRGKYLIKSYNFFKSMSQVEKPYENCDNYIRQLTIYTREIMEYMDQNFVLELLLEYIDKEYTKVKEEYFYEDMIPVISAYTLYAKDEETQLQKYNKVVLPLLKRYFDLSDDTDEGKTMKKVFKRFLSQLGRDLCNYVKEKRLIIPIKMFLNIQKELEKLPVPEYYMLLCRWKLIVAMASAKDESEGQEIQLEPLTEESSEQNNQDLMIAKELGNRYSHLLKEDVKTHFLSIYVLFSKILNDVASFLPDNLKWNVYKQMLADENDTVAFLTVIDILRDYSINDDSPEILKEIHESIKNHPSVEVKMHYYYKFVRNNRS